MKKSPVLWTLTLIVLSISLSACCGGGKEKVVVVPAENSAAQGSGATTGQALQDLKAAHDQGVLSDEEFAKEKQKLLKKE